jgi:hypothetical protein
LSSRIRWYSSTFRFAASIVTMSNTPQTKPGIATVSAIAEKPCSRRGRANLNVKAARYPVKARLGQGGNLAGG